MPHFDYCSTITCYFPEVTLQKIYNTCNYIISKLLNLNATVDATFLYFCSKFINNFILNDLTNNLCTFSCI